MTKKRIVEEGKPALRSSVKLSAFIRFLLFEIVFASALAGTIATPAEGAVDACRDAKRTVHYDVAAIDIAIPINGWGDINPQGMMYVLNNPQAIPNVAHIRDPDFKLYDSTDESLPKKIQPLVLRANVGDCIEISLTNLLDIQRNVGMQIMGLPYDPLTSDGAFVGNNPDTTVAQGAAKTYRWFASRTGGFMFRDNSNVQFPQDTITKGLFGMVIVEPEGSTWFDSVTGRNFLLANPQIGYNITDLTQTGTDPITGKPVFTGVGASIFASIHQQAGAPLPKGTLLWENVTGNDFRDYAIIMHDEFEGRVAPIAWNEDGTIAAFGEEFFPATGLSDDTFLINYRSEPLRNREGAWERHRGLIPVPGIGLVDGSKPMSVTTHDGITVDVIPPFVNITIPNLQPIIVNSSNMTVILPSGRKFGPDDDFCNGGKFPSDNAMPSDPDYTFYPCEGEESHLQGWPFGDPAVALPRAYWGDPVILWVGNADSHDSHTFHQHTHRWFHDPDQADINLMPVPENPIQLSNRLDVQGVSAGEVFKIVFEQGAGGMMGTAGDAIMHCHLYPHFAGGIWSAVRIFDKLRINFTDPANINSNLPDGTPLLYPDGTQEAALVPLPARLALFDTRVPEAVDKRAAPPRGMPNRTATAPDKDHPGYPNFVAGKFGLKALQPPKFIVDPNTGLPTKDRATPTRLETLASYDGIRPGATLVDPCAGPNGEFGRDRKPDRIYQPVALQVPFLQNAKGGFFNPEQRAYVERDMVEQVRKDPSLLKPYSFRANVGDCVEVHGTNELQRDEDTPSIGVNDGVYLAPINTPEVTNHVHIIRFDELGSDGTSVNWNYDISQRIGETGAYRWFVDINGRTVFSHDHQFPTTGQQNGLWSAFIVEPMNSIYRNQTTGNPLGPMNATTYELTSKKYPIENAMGVGVAADIIVDPATSDTLGGISGGSVSAFREFAVHYSDFTPSFAADPAALKDAFAELGTGNGMLNNDPYRSDLKVFSKSLRTMPYMPPFTPVEFLADQGTTTLNYRVEPFQARLNLSDPGATDAMKEPAYIYSSVIHGDPETEVFRAYAGDPVVIRFMDGAQEEHHVFEIHGHRWLHQASDPNTFPTDNQASNIGEWFNYELIGNTFLRDTANGTSFQAADTDLAAGLPGDYLFGSTSMPELWNGMWGIFRVENGINPDLKPLPGRTAPQEVPGLGLLPHVVDPSRKVTGVTPELTGANSPCPVGAPAKHFDIVAIQNFTAYNSRFNVSDPFTLMYVLAEDEASVRNGTKLPEPLVIRANAGDCIEVKLENHMPDLPVLAENMNVLFPDGNSSPTSLDPNTMQHFGDSQMAAMVTGLPLAPKFVFTKWPMSNRVSLHPHLLKTVASVGDGATVGYMADQTIAPGENITYLWYADKEVGATLLDDYGDQRSHRHHGLFAALIIEPGDSIYLDPADLNKEIRSGTSAVIQNTTTGEQFREFVPVFANGLNLRKENTLIPDAEGPIVIGEGEHPPCSPESLLCEDIESSGDSGINYRTERLEYRVPFNPLFAHVGHPGEEVFNPDTFKVFSSKANINGTVFGDPVTPVFEAFVGDPVVVRVLKPADLAKVQAIGVDGHSWQHEFNDPGTNIVNSEGSIGVGKSLNFYLLGGAGGEQQQPGDYMYNTRNHVEGVMLKGGQWGLLRVHDTGAPANIQPLTLRAESLKTVTTEQPITKAPARVLTAIIVSPATATLSAGSTQTFSASTIDQVGDPISAAVEWSSSNTAVGTIDASGLFTAKAAGITTITAAGGVISGTAVVTVTAQSIQASAPGGSGGVGGGGVTSSEPYENIEKAERHGKPIISDKPVTYDFNEPEHGIYQIVVTGMENENDMVIRVEVLKGTSKLVSIPPLGMVYKNLNIWAGTKRIKEALIRFKIENSWLAGNGFTGEDIRMLRWDGSKWVELGTEMKTKDDTLTYFDASTDSLSSFAITGLKDTAVRAEVLPVKVTETAPKPEASPSAPKGTPGFGIAIAASALFVLFMLLRRGRK